MQYDTIARKVLGEMQEAKTSIETLDVYKNAKRRLEEFEEKEEKTSVKKVLAAVPAPARRDVLNYLNEHPLLCFEQGYWKK